MAKLLILLMYFCGTSLLWAQEESTNLSCQAPVVEGQEPPLGQPGELPFEPYPVQLDFRGYGVFAGVVGQCGQGWNACPCEEECRKHIIAECKG